jgi:glutamine amidotransferase-like uncharacterized protein
MLCLQFFRRIQVREIKKKDSLGSSIFTGILCASFLSACQGTEQSSFQNTTSQIPPSSMEVGPSPPLNSSQTSLPPSSPPTVIASSSAVSNTKSTPTPSKRSYSIDVLLFAGTGTWSTEVLALESILKTHGLTYRKMSSAQLNALSLVDLSQYGLMIFPGGAGGSQSQSLTPQIHALLRSAVQDQGVSYLGFCAGAFIAVAPAPLPGQDVSYGLGIVGGPELDYYYLENQISPDVAMTLESFADGSQRDLLWYGGPVTPHIPGGVVAKYPNGDPAITQLFSGKGFVMLSGPHPAAPESVKTSFGLTDTDGSDVELAWDLIQAALQQKPFQAF